MLGIQRRLPRTAAIGVVLLITTGTLPAVGDTAAAQTSDVDLAYGCLFPSGARQVTVRVTASLPKAGTVGRAIQPGKPTIAITVPRSALEDVTKLDAATVGATVGLAVQVAQPGTSAATVWQDLAAAQTALSLDDDLTLEASGSASAVRITAAGEAAFVAGQLDIGFVPRKADGTATTPAVIPLTCTPALGYDTTIGTVAISDGSASAGAGGHAQIQQAAASADGDDFCPPPPTGGLNPRFPLPTVPPGAVEFPGSPEEGCALVSGLSNVKKLNGAAPIGGIAGIIAGVRLFADFTRDGDYLRIDNYGVAQLEPRRATLLTFGFMPVSATIELTQLGNMNFISEGPAFTDTPRPTLVTAWADVLLRLTDARVNGVPLDLGAHCRAAQPVELILHGSTSDEIPYKVVLGGRLTGEITIPPFTGCGVGEDLDPLLTASISGPGNSVQIIQGPLCEPLRPDLNGQPCPPVEFGFTVEPGGQWQATGGVTTARTVSGPAVTVTCQSVEMNGTFKSGTGVAPTAIGRVTDVATEGCTGTTPLAGPFTITPQGLPWTLDADFYTPATDTTTGHFRGASLHFSTVGCSFDVTDPIATAAVGIFKFTYANPTHTLTLTPTGSSAATLRASNVNGCTTGFSSPIREGTNVRFGSAMSFDPPQTLIAP